MEASVLENKLLEHYAPPFAMPSSQALLFALRQVVPDVADAVLQRSGALYRASMTNESAVTPSSNTGLGLKTMIDARQVSNSLGMELIDCIELPVLVVRRDLTLVSFNPAAAKLLSLTGSDHGRQLQSIQMFTGVKNLEDLCEHVIASGSSHRVEVADGAGSWFSLNISCHKANQDIKGAVLTLTNVTAFRESLERAIEEREYTKAVINTIADALVIVDADLRIQAANQAFYALFQTSRERSQGATFYQLGSGDWDIPRLRSLIDGSSASNDYLGSLECDQELAAGRRTLLLNARRLNRGGQAGQMTLITIQDITERKKRHGGVARERRGTAYPPSRRRIPGLRTRPEEARTNGHRRRPGIEPGRIWRVLL